MLAETNDISFYCICWWSVTTVKDLLTIRADRDNYYFGAVPGLPMALRWACRWWFQSFCFTPIWRKRAFWLSSFHCFDHHHPVMRNVKLSSSMQIVTSNPACNINSRGMICFVNVQGLIASYPAERLCHIKCVGCFAGNSGCARCPSLIDLSASWGCVIHATPRGYQEPRQCA